MSIPADPADRTPRIVRTAAELSAAMAQAIEAKAPEHGTATLGLVPTMGALHSGHESLVSTARAQNDVLVVSIFVNELQFNDAQDFARYPRTLEADVEILARAGADIVFAPEATEVYPDGRPLVRLDSGELGSKFEGASRPGHFDGMLAVVAKLLHFAMPPATLGVPVSYRAYFGQKDAQQLVLINRMVADLNYPVEIRSVPIIRSAEGLALSSRNQFLTGEQAKAALVIHRALVLVKERADRHEPLYLEDAAGLFDMEPLVELDYFELVDPRTLKELAFNCQDTPFTGEGLLLVAAKVGGVRLIDNMTLGY
ncbi:pantoate--beta-alanine ligase [Paeniglutamicibacter sp. ABSL32-1]|uniref:pantoate--beta-alanine ligase n=1 Tax=Paeniglutamicibacter quisquiliarum TaxID=2849498 RepID=UPI001C2DBE0C|nr:pantoate--beta-alanine ligase [Paeniglutamicibacter quisquiliarum]